MAEAPTEDYVVDGMTCMHCRFVKENVSQHISDLFSGNFETTSNLHEFLYSSISSVSHPICELHVDDKLVKYSVIHQEDDDIPFPSFVHLQEKGAYISCCSGTCKASTTGKRSTRRLLTMGEATLCPHLTIMKDQHEEWSQYCSTAGNG